MRKCLKDSSVKRNQVIVVIVVMVTRKRKTLASIAREEV